MGRVVNFVPEVGAQVEDYLKAKKIKLGFLLGQQTTQKDIILHLCPVPEKTDDDDEVKEDSKKSTKKNKSSQTDNKKIDFLSQFEESWICQYAKEVSRSLSGGFDVLGIYMVSNSESLSINHVKLREFLYSITKTLKKDKDLSMHPDLTDGILLHICLISSKCTCRTYDVSDIKSTPTPAEWKILPSVARWHTLKSHITLDLQFAIKSSDKDASVKKQIESGLLPLYKRVLNAKALINDAFRDGEEQLTGAHESKKSKQKGPIAEKTFIVDLLLPLESSICASESETIECAMTFAARGIMECRAFVHSKATVQEAVKAFQQDVIRSLRARCDIHGEDLLLNEAKQQGPVGVYELPKRVFAPLCGILVSDYPFPGDSHNDSVLAFKELLNIDIEMEDLQDYELAPDINTLMQSTIKEECLPDTKATSPPERSIFLPVFCATMAAVAAGFALLVIGQE